MNTEIAAPGIGKARRRLTPGGVLTFFAYLGAVGLVVIAGLIFTGQVGARVVLTNSMAPAINQGDLVVTYNWLKPSVGQVAIYKAHNLEGKVSAEFVHRVVSGSSTTEYTFKGDNNLVIDPFKVEPTSVVGVLQFTIPRASIFLQPLALAGFFIGLILFYFLVAFIRHRRSRPEEPQVVSLEKEAKVKERNQLSPRLKAWLSALVGLVVLVTALNLLAVVKVFGLEHPQIGPKLAVGNANSTIVAVAPGAEAKLGQYAIASLPNGRNFVRIDGITATGYKVATMDGAATIAKDKLDGPMLFFIPFIGYLWLPFGL